MGERLSLEATVSPECVSTIPLIFSPDSQGCRAASTAFGLAVLGHQVAAETIDHITQRVAGMPTTPLGSLRLEAWLVGQGCELEHITPPDHPDEDTWYGRMTYSDRYTWYRERGYPEAFLLQYFPPEEDEVTTAFYHQTPALHSSGYISRSGECTPAFLRDALMGSAFISGRYDTGIIKHSVVAASCFEIPAPVSPVYATYLFNPDDAKPCLEMLPLEYLAEQFGGSAFTIVRK
jgi:hypothetical protein